MLRNERMLLIAVGVAWALLRIGVWQTGHDGLEVAAATTGAPLAVLLARAVIRLLGRPLVARAVALCLGYIALLLGLGSAATDLGPPVAGFVIGTIAPHLLRTMLGRRPESE